MVGWVRLGLGLVPTRSNATPCNMFPSSAFCPHIRSNEAAAAISFVYLCLITWHTVFHYLFSFPFELKMNEIHVEWHFNKYRKRREKKTSSTLPKRSHNTDLLCRNEHIYPSRAEHIPHGWIDELAVARGGAHELSVAVLRVTSFSTRQTGIINGTTALSFLFFWILISFVCCDGKRVWLGRGGQTHRRPFRNTCIELHVMAGRNANNISDFQNHFL